MTRRGLRHGYTTGACAAAAAKGAALMLRHQRLVDEVELSLPAGIAARFRLYGQEFTADFASCYVVKDAGDDPDVTNGAEIHARVRVLEGDEGGETVIIEGGKGVGRVTKPGLAVPVGEWAINPVPRRMIAEAIRDVFAAYQAPFTIHCSLSVPNGEQLSRKTLNARLGIVGGLSILGTTGVVKPISAKAWTDTIDAAIDVALACGCATVVLSTGRTSELVAQRHLGTGDGGPGTLKPGTGKREPGSEEKLKEEAFIMMGDHAGYALRACARKGARQVVIAGQFAKLLKIACGHEQTHVSSSELDLTTLAEWLRREPRTSNLELLAKRANTARQVLEDSAADAAIVALVCGKARAFAETLVVGAELKVLLAGYGGEVLYFG